MTPDNHLYESVVRKISLSGCSFEVLEHEPFYTMEEVRNGIKISSNEMGKTIVLSVENLGLIAVVIPGLLKIDLSKVAAVVSKSRNKVKFARKEELEPYGILLGAISPFFDCFAKVIIDESFLPNETIYCGSGDLCKTIVILTANMISLTSAVLVDVVSKT